MEGVMNPTTADSSEQLRAENQRLRDQISVLTKSTASASCHVAPVAVNDDRFRIMWESSVDAMVLSDAEGIILDANQAYYDLYGYQPEQVINQSFAIIFSPDQHTQAIEQYRELIRTRTVYPAYETTIQRANGEQRVVESRASFVTSNDGQITLLSIIRDITDQKQAKAVLRASREQDQYRQIVETAQEGIWVIDANNTTSFVNARMAALLGYTINEMIGASLFAFLNPADYGAVTQKVALRHDGIAEQYERCFRHKSGANIWMLLDCNPLYDHAGVYLGALAMATDISDRKRAEDALRASEERFRAIIENGVEGIILIDADFETRYVSPTVTTLLGYSTETFATLRLSNLCHHDDMTRLNGYIAALKTRAGATEQITARMQHQDGSWRWMEQRGTNQLHNPAINAIIISFHDVTERKHAEAALHQSEVRFTKIFHSSPVGMAINRLDDGCFLDVNESFLHLIGYSSAEMVGKSWRTPDLFADPDAMHDLALQMRTTGNAQNQQIRLRTKQGDVRTVLFSAEPLVLDGHDCFISTCIDITERVRAQEVVQRTAERLATLHAVDQAILKLHAPTTIANAVITSIRALIPCQYASVMLYDAANAHGQLLTVRSDLPMLQPIGVPFPLHLDDFPAAFCQGAPWIEQDVQALVQAEHTPPMVATIASKHVRALLNIPLMVESKLIGTLNLAATMPAVFTDEHVMIAQEIGDTLSIALHNARLVESLQQELAARTRAEVALTAEHERVVQLKNEFMATMSHELRTPLTAVLGQAELLSAGIYGSLNEDQTIAIQSIDQSGQHLLALINDILDYTRIEAGHLKLELQDVAVTDLCIASLHMLKQAIHAKQIALTITIDSNVTIIQADVRRLKQILVNLLANAVKFTPREGKIGLEVAGDVAHKQVVFTIWDTGIGIAADDLLRLFQPFTQVDSSLSRQYEGTGLGLALVQRLTEAHGGSVSVTSTVGQGSRFSATLPWQPRLHEVSKLTPSLPPSRAVPDRSERSGVLPLILLVEDNESTILLLQRALPSYGYQVHVAHDGTEALGLVRETRPALILMDIQLPGISGIEVIQQIRDNPQMRQLPMIALTALVMPGDRERCLDAGADDYLPKPVSIHILLERIAAQLARS
jgi:PAS domain S-box-containing protein